jgi:GNAT superfamily N-acetyltransferase
MSMIDEDANTETVNQTAKVPDLPKPAPSKERSAWNLVTTVPRAAVGELAAGAIDVGVGLYRGLRDSARVKTKEEHQQEARYGSGFDGQNEASRSIRNVIDDIRPDPVTSHAAEQFVFEAGRVVVKAVGLGLTTGPGAIPLLAASEGIETSDALQQKGVAKATADQAGVVSALTTGIGAVIPVAPALKGFTGNNVAKVVGLAGVSGPATFMAQQKLTSDILGAANYTELAKQYDPLDLQGLTLSMIPGLAFGGLALRGGAKPSAAVTPLKPGATPQVQPLAQASIAQPAITNVASAVSQDAIDAAMTHNLTLLRDAQVLRGPNRPNPVLPNDISIRPTAIGFEAIDQTGKVVGKLESNITPEQAKQINENASVDIVKVDPEYKGQGVGSALYDAFNTAFEGKIMPSGKTSADAWKVWKRNYPEKVDAFVQQEAKRIREGADTSQVLSNIADLQVKEQVCKWQMDSKISR